jgi:hypothetical protein
MANMGGNRAGPWQWSNCLLGGMCPYNSSGGPEAPESPVTLCPASPKSLPPQQVTGSGAQTQGVFSVTVSALCSTHYRCA